MSADVLFLLIPSWHCSRWHFQDFSRLAYHTSEAHPEAAELFTGSVFQKVEGNFVFLNPSMSSVC
jgi:hypothetical protein